MDPKDLGSAIRAKRKKLGLPQTRLAKYSNVGPRFIGELEAGKETVQLGKTLKVLSSLGLDVTLKTRGGK